MQNSFTPRKVRQLAAKTYIHVCWRYFCNTGKGSDFESKGNKLFSNSCWLQDSNPGSLAPILKQTESLLTNQLSYRVSSEKYQFNSPSKCSVSIPQIWSTTSLVVVDYISSPLHFNKAQYEINESGIRNLLFEQYIIVNEIHGIFQ